MKIINTKTVRFGLSMLGVGGVGLTSYLSIRGHEKAKELPPEDKKGRIIAWLPAIISGLATGACIIAPTCMANHEIAALTVGLGYAAAKHDKIEAVLREKLGDEKAKEVKHEAEKELRKEQKESSEVVVQKTGYGNVHFIEPILGTEFLSSKERVDWSFRMLNDMFRHGDTVNMNTLHELWNVRKTRPGYEYGWPNRESEEMFGYSLDEPIYHEIVPGLDENGEEVYWIEIYTTPPILGYMEA